MTSASTRARRCSSPASGRTCSPFFQIGVNEVQGHLPGRYAPSRYYAFWSSARLHFHPHFLFSVRAHDRVRLSMRLSHARWYLTASDVETGRSRTVVAASGGAMFSIGQWAQEDVTENNAGKTFDYPALEAVRFSDVRVNAAVPSQRSMQRTWMSTDRGTFGPTPLRAGAFVLKVEHLTAADLRYQQIAVRLNYPALAFDAILQKALTTHRTRPLKAASIRFARVLAHNSAAFTSYHWPPDVRGPVRRLVGATEQNRTIVVALGAADPSELWRRLRAFTRSALGIRRAALRLKERLGLPQSQYSGASISHYVQTHTH